MVNGLKWGLSGSGNGGELSGMDKHEWRERTEEGVRFWRATRHAGRWTFQTTLKSDPEWELIDPVPRELWEALRDVLWRKYQRKRCPWELIERIDKLLEDDDPESRGRNQG